jgi:hypothetical protein
MVDLSPTTTYLADANLFIRAGTPSRDAAQALIAFFTREPWTLVIHPAVDTELTNEARTYTRHRTLQQGIDDGWATIASLPADPVAPVTDLEDAARDCIARKTNRTPDAIEDTDVQLVVLAAERLERDKDTDIGIITNDIAAGTCFDRVLTHAGYKRVEYIDAKQLLTTLREWYTSPNMW